MNLSATTRRFGAYVAALPVLLSAATVASAQTKINVHTGGGTSFSAPAKQYELPKFSAEELAVRTKEAEKNIVLGDADSFLDVVIKIVDDEIHGRNGGKYKSTWEELLKKADVIGPNAKNKSWKPFFDLAYAYKQEQDNSVERFRARFPNDKYNMQKYVELAPKEFGESTPIFDFRNVSKFFLSQTSKENMALAFEGMCRGQGMVYKDGLQDAVHMMEVPSAHISKEDADTEFNARKISLPLRTFGAVRDWINLTRLGIDKETKLPYFQQVEYKARKRVAMGLYDNGPEAALQITVNWPGNSDDYNKFVKNAYSALPWIKTTAFDSNFIPK